ncbi:MAG TPA: PIN domain-containing protein, partial [bacterium]
MIDYENVQGINLTQIERMDCRVCVFTGSSQNKIPIDLVSSAQRLGNRLNWIRIDGNGPNALDFHIAYYLGTQIAMNPADEYFVLSRDKGFDPLIKHIAKKKMICKRISSISEIESIKRPKDADGDYGRVVHNLRKIDKSKRPRNKKTLRQHLKT